MADFDADIFLNRDDNKLLHLSNVEITPDYRHISYFCKAFAQIFHSWNCEQFNP